MVTNESDTILVRHLPSELSARDKEDLLTHIGATHVRVMSNTGPLRNTAFATFPGHDEAVKAVKVLHHQKILGCCLVAQLSSNHYNNLRPQQLTDQPTYSKESRSHDKKETLKSKEKEQVEDTTSKPATTPSVDMISDRLGVSYPANPNLFYCYPDPNPIILSNILHALSSVPKFYTQVLHLMNKMNLPAPFNATPPPIKLPAMPMTAPMPAMLPTQMPTMLPPTQMPGMTPMQPPAGLPMVPPLPPVGAPQPVPPPTAVIPHTYTHPPPVLPPHPHDMPAGSGDILATGSSGTQPPLPDASVPQRPPLPLADDGDNERGSSEESEIGSDSEAAQNATSTTSALPKLRKRKAAMAAPDLKKARLNYEKNVASASDKYASSGEKSANKKADVKDVFETVNESVTKKRGEKMTLLKSSAAATQEKPEDFVVESSGGGEDGFGKIAPAPKPAVEQVDLEGAEQEWGEVEFIKSRELREGRLSQREMREHRLFQKYSAGEPSSRLYVKNLAKATTEEDLHRIFGRYVDWSNTMDRLTFDIRLMTEGRMKGQAFITLPNQEAAEYCIKETNGFVLNDKPMIVLYGRSAKPKGDENKTAKK